jgi:hypothetical protein
LLEQHHSFLTSPSYTTILSLLATLTPTPPTIHHALLSSFSPSSLTLTSFPVTGTAIYLSPTPSFPAAWAKWVSIVQLIPGFLGIAGGPILEAVSEGAGKGGKEGKQHEGAFIAFVGWESVDVHEAYHRTRHFKETGRKVLLNEVEGFVGYGHVAFSYSEEKAGINEREAKL